MVITGRKGRGELGEVLRYFHLSPLKMVYIVDLQQSTSLIIPCAWGYSPDQFQQMLQFKSFKNTSEYGHWIAVINRHSEQGLIIKAWTSNYTIYNHNVWYYGLELSFSSSFYDLNKNTVADGTSKFGLYRCASFDKHLGTTFPDDISGSAFVISIEGIML